MKRNKIMVRIVPEENKVKVYRIKDLWNLPGTIVKDAPIPELVTADYWFFSMKQLTHKALKYHMMRSLAADLSYPITCFPNGKVADGFHRIMKAEVFGHKTIDIKTLDDWPPVIKEYTMDEFMTISGAKK